MPKPTWAEERAKRIGAEIKRLRGKNTGQWLADETERHGHTVSRTTISEIENGKRRDITLSEITVIARALAVSPVQLIYPDLAHGPVEVLPNAIVNSAQAVRWFSGEAVLPDDLASLGPQATPMRRTRILYKYAVELRGSLNVLESLRDMSSEGAAAAAMRVEAAATTLNQWIELMDSEGMDVTGTDLESLSRTAQDAVSADDA